MKTKKTAITIYDHGTHHSFLPFDLPAGKRGNMEITIKIAPNGSSLTVVSMRNSIFMGLEPAKLIVNRDTQIHELTEGGQNGAGLWMTSRPQEIEQHNRQLARAHGNVLVGGLGIGMAVGILHLNKKVKTITVIEKNSDVIKLVERYLPIEKTRVIFGDLYLWLKQCKKNGITYDFAFYDIWQPTSQFVLHQHMMPLRRLSKGIVAQNMIELWNEQEVIGQVAMTLNNWIGPEREVIRRLMLQQLSVGSLTDMSLKDLRDFGDCNREAYPFFAWMHKIKPSDKLAELYAKRFLHALSNAELYDEVWKKFEDYGKEANNARGKLETSESSLDSR